MTLDNAGAGVEPGNSAASSDAPVNGSPGSGADWTSGLNEGNRKLVERTGWKSVDDAFTSYTNLETKLSEAPRLPGKDAKPEDWQKVFDSVKPEKPEGYEFKLPDGLPETFAYDKTMADEFKAWSHKAGLHPSQAAAVHDLYVQKTAAMMAESQAAEDKSVGDAHAAIVKAWGAPETETYKQNITYIDRALASKPGLLDAFKESGFLTADGAVKNAVVAQTLAEWGKQLFGEDSLHKGEGVNRTVNPFHVDTENITQQQQVINADPQRARELIKQAGRDPKRWSL